MFRNFSLLCCVFLLAACSQSPASLEPVESPIAPPTVEPTEYTISLGMGGELTLDDPEPMKSGISTDLYGVQVYSRKQGSNADYSPCAYGLFDDPSKMVINLVNVYEYKFVMSMVVNGIEELYCGFSEYGFPFLLGTLPRRCDNHFIWTSKPWEEMRNLDSGRSKVTATADYYRPFLDRYHGEIAGYVPQENGSLSIDLKRVVYGVRFVVEGLTDGHLAIFMEDSPTIILQSSGPDPVTVEKIVTFKNNIDDQDRWTEDTYSEDVKVSTVWRRDDGNEIPVVNETITFKRKVWQPIRIAISDKWNNNGLNMGWEDQSMEESDELVF